MSAPLHHIHQRLVERCGSTDPLADEYELARQIKSGEAKVHRLQSDGRVQYNVHLRGQPFIVVVGVDSMILTILNAEAKVHTTPPRIAATVIAPRARESRKHRYMRRLKARRRERSKRERQSE